MNNDAAHGPLLGASIQIYWRRGLHDGKQVAVNIEDLSVDESEGGRCEEYGHADEVIGLAQGPESVHDLSRHQMETGTPPVQKPTSCMFGGPDLATLYVTSAVWDHSAEDLKSQTQAGGLFALDVGVRGLPEPRFAG